MNTLKMWFTAGVLVVAGLVAAPMAQAVSGYAYHPTDPSYAHVWDNHWFQACDRQVDRHRVRMHYYTVARPDLLLYGGWAPSKACSETASTSYFATIIKFRICVEAEGCGPWKQH